MTADCCVLNSSTPFSNSSGVHGSTLHLNVAKIVVGRVRPPKSTSKVFTCSLDRTTLGMSPSRLAMFTFAPCVINSFAIWSISRPLAVWSGVFPANVTLFTSAPRDIKYSATWYFPASTAWCKGVRPLLESYVFGQYRLFVSFLIFFDFFFFSTTSTSPQIKPVGFNPIQDNAQPLFYGDLVFWSWDSGSILSKESVTWSLISAPMSRSVSTNCWLPFKVATWSAEQPGGG